jgi:hypothetical protein
MAQMADVLILSANIPSHDSSFASYLHSQRCYVQDSEMPAAYA